jgi:hypothetical protein
VNSLAGDKLDSATLRIGLLFTGSMRVKMSLNIVKGGILLIMYTR